MTARTLRGCVKRYKPLPAMTREERTEYETLRRYGMTRAEALDAIGVQDA